jgi:VIT1/CCC1 family predicted Fe2+/Mn2+ transporter
MSTLKACLMGGVDGVITSFAVAVGATFMEDDVTSTVAVVGFSSVVADGLSMGISEYVSSVSEGSVTDRKGSPLLLGVVCFVSFVGCGTFPLVVFLVARQRLLACASFALVELMLLGSGQTYVTREPLLRGLARTSVLGTLAGLAAYGVGYVASRHT